MYNKILYAKVNKQFFKLQCQRVNTSQGKSCIPILFNPDCSSEWYIYIHRRIYLLQWLPAENVRYPFRYACIKHKMKIDVRRCTVRIHDEICDLFVQYFMAYHYTHNIQTHTHIVLWAFVLRFCVDNTNSIVRCKIKIKTPSSSMFHIGKKREEKKNRTRRSKLTRIIKIMYYFCTSFPTRNKVFCARSSSCEDFSFPFVLPFFSSSFLAESCWETLQPPLR